MGDRTIHEIETLTIRIPMRLVVAFGTALLLTLLLSIYLSKTFTGRAIKAVAQDEPARRPIVDLAGHRVELEPGPEPRDLAQVEGKAMRYSTSDEGYCFFS
jgi:hypothetical protein